MVSSGHHLGSASSRSHQSSGAAGNQSTRSIHPSSSSQAFNYGNPTEEAVRANESYGATSSRAMMPFAQSGISARSGHHGSSYSTRSVRPDAISTRSDAYGSSSRPDFTSSRSGAHSSAARSAAGSSRVLVPTSSSSHGLTRASSSSGSGRTTTAVEVTEVSNSRGTATRVRVVMEQTGGTGGMVIQLGSSGSGSDASTAGSAVRRITGSSSGSSSGSVHSRASSGSASHRL